MQLRLTQFRLCPFSRATRLILGEHNAAVELTDVHPWSPSRPLLEQNPAGTLPVLEGGDGVLFCGFYPFFEFVEDARRTGRHPLRVLMPAPASEADPAGASDDEIDPIPLLPDDLDERAEVRRLIDWFNVKCDREVTQELVYEKVRAILDRSTSNPPNAAILRAARANLRYHLSYLGFLSDQRRWLAGDQFSAADIVAAAHISIVDYLGEVRWAEHPFVKDWYQRLKSRRSFQPLLRDRVTSITPPAHYDDLDF